MRASVISIALLAFTGTNLLASVSVELSAPASTIQVGETLNVTANATDSATSGTRFSYQFTVRPHNQGAFSTVQDYFFNNAFLWTPTDHEGSYDIGVTAWSEATGATGANYITVNVQSRVTANKPVLSDTNNVLVAFYSAPPCTSPATMRVQFKASSSPNNFTPYKPCNGLSMNFYLAGMYANTAYTVQQFVSGSAGTVPGPQLTYTTGSIPSDVSFPQRSTLVGPTPPTSNTYPYLLQLPTGESAYAADLSGNLVWYVKGSLVRPVSGGTFFSIENDPANSKIVCKNTTSPGCGDHQYLREIDLAGNMVRQTSWSIMNDRLNAIRVKQGRPPVRLTYLSHDAIRLPNGYTVAIATNEQVKTLTSGVKDMFGDTIIVLNTHLQVVWGWDAFDYLDVNRVAIPVTCTAGVGGCPQVYLQKQPNGQTYTHAVDFTHANALTYDPSDGNLVVSLRHQSWAVKINYANGSGDGHIVWKLGYGGSFSLPAGDPVSEWFSGQHNVELQPNGVWTLFDNNNPSSVTHQPGGNAHGQAWRLDVATNTATPVVDIDLGVQSLALGSSALLSNGNYEWQAGLIDNTLSQTFEYTPSGKLVFKQQNDTTGYRTFRLQDLYTP